MASLIQIPTFCNEVGRLSVLEKLLPGEVKRVFFIHGTPRSARRGGHAHRRSHQALVCVAGSCRVFVANDYAERHFTLSQPDQGLVLFPGDWHTMDEFAPGTVLLVLSNGEYDPTEYTTVRPRSCQRPGRETMPTC